MCMANGRLGLRIDLLAPTPQHAATALIILVNALTAMYERFSANVLRQTSLQSELFATPPAAYSGCRYVNDRNSHVYRQRISANE